MSTKSAEHQYNIAQLTLLTRDIKRNNILAMVICNYVLKGNGTKAIYCNRQRKQISKEDKGHKIHLQRQTYFKHMLCIVMSQAQLEHDCYCMTSRMKPEVEC